MRTFRVSLKTVRVGVSLFEVAAKRLGLSASQFEVVARQLTHESVQGGCQTVALNRQSLWVSRQSLFECSVYTAQLPTIGPSTRSLSRTSLLKSTSMLHVARPAFSRRREEVKMRRRDAHSVDSF